MQEQSGPGTHTHTNTTVVLALSQKNTGLSVLLTILFGSLGLLYSSIVGGIIMFIVETVLFIPTLGLAAIVTHPICVIWGIIAVKNHNQQILTQTTIRS
jgi:hypothetical protein